MGQRYVQLESTYTGHETNKTATLHVSQLPPNPAILVPGPALLFVVVNGVPSVGVQVMIGSGQLGAQETLPIGDLPESDIILGGTPNTSSNQVNGARSNGGLFGKALMWGMITAGVFLG